MALITYPLNNVEYTAEDAELFHVTRTSGVYANDSFDYSVTGADNTVVINSGIGWIKNTDFSGKVVALKSAVSLDMGLSDSVYPRIDAIVIQFDANSNETNIIAKQGNASSVPIAPTITRTETIYELHLYHVRREAGSLYIDSENITDLRMDSSYCGLMADSVTDINTNAVEVVDNLTTNSPAKALSAAQGVTLKGLIDAVRPVTGGGTGATTAAAARMNLDITPANIGAFATYPARTATDANTIYDAGLYLITGGVNLPTQYGTLVVLPYRNVTGNAKTDYCAQLFLPTGDHPDTGIFYRTSKADTWNDWNKLIGRVLDSKMYGDTLPADANEKGRLFFLKA